jgi:hypothetical protein
MKTTEHTTQQENLKFPIQVLISKTITIRKTEVAILENDVKELERNAQAVSAAFRRLKSAVADGECESDVSHVRLSHTLLDLDAQLRAVRSQISYIDKMDTLLTALYHEVVAEVPELTPLLPPSLREPNALVNKEVK